MKKITLVVISVAMVLLFAVGSVSAYHNPSNRIFNAQKVVKTPVANFAVLPSVVHLGQCVQLRDLSTNGPTSWEWVIYQKRFVPNYGSNLVTVFGSTQKNPSWKPDNLGFYYVSLYATNSAGTGAKFVEGAFQVIP